MLREQILKKLELNPYTPLPGQQLADEFQVSRNAVWKAIQALKDEGYPIIADGRKGYRLQANTDLLTEDGIRAHLSDMHKSLPIYIYKSLDSTNQQALRMIADGYTEAALITAEKQTSGKGHAGASFQSPTARGLYATMILPVALDYQRLPNVSRCIAVAVVRALAQILQHSFQIRKINDIYDGDRKICGILSQAFTADLESEQIQIICTGIGIYLEHTTDKDENKSIAASADIIPQNGSSALLPDTLNGAGDLLSDTQNSEGDLLFDTLQSTAGRCRLAAAITEELLSISFSEPEELLRQYAELHTQAST